MIHVKLGSVCNEKMLFAAGAACAPGVQVLRPRKIPPPTPPPHPSDAEMALGWIDSAGGPSTATVPS